MHTILVPVDGSGHALKALRIASDLAEKYDGELVLLHVLAHAKSAEDFLALAVAKTFDPRILELLKKQAKQPTTPLPDKALAHMGELILKHAIERVHGKVPVRALPIKDGDPADVILQAISDNKANTLVMGSRGITGDEQSSFGSVSHKVFAHADCTCISVK